MSQSKWNALSHLGAFIAGVLLVLFLDWGKSAQLERTILLLQRDLTVAVTYGINSEAQLIQCREKRMNP